MQVLFFRRVANCGDRKRLQAASELGGFLDPRVENQWCRVLALVRVEV